MVNYITIEDELEDLSENNNRDTKGFNKFITTLYKNRYGDNVFETNPNRMINLRLTHSKLQELAEEAGKKKDVKIMEEIVFKYILKQFEKIFSQEVSQ